MGTFIISKIEILEKCKPSIRKNLTGNSYIFTNQPDFGFFGNNITVQAIVGMNGSGKSSLLELMFRMINNLAAMMFHEVECKAAETLLYIKGIYANLYYEIDGVKGLLECRDSCIALVFGRKKIAMGKNCLEIFQGYEDYTNAEEEEYFKIASIFFYTIVTNYSMQAYIADDYKNEYSKYYDIKNRKWKRDYGRIWINSLFHKNDGYMCPINLNPYRSNGVIDMDNETKLTMYRIVTLLIIFQESGRDYLKGYKLNRIDYRFNKEKVVSSFKDEIENESLPHKYKRIIEQFKQVCTNLEINSTAQIILNCFNLTKTDEKDHELLWVARLYLVRKVLSIGAKYPTYVKFKVLEGSENVFSIASKQEAKRITKGLAKKVKEDKSHIGIKIRQVLHFIRNFQKIPNADMLFKKFNYQNYSEWLNTYKKDNSVYDFMNILPPSFFQPTVILDKMNDEGSKIIGTTSFSRLSSGEKQFLFTSSAIIYHLMNLRSIRKGRPKYRHFNIILDEAEICFHPEYQRTFLYNFLHIIKMVGFQDRCGINIILTTHSPFILSDIPKDNILYLENGQPQDSNNFKNPFAANINDILKQSFFLKEGFMGALAQRKINDLILFLKSDHTGRTLNMNLAPQLIEKVGDPLLYTYLKRSLKDFNLKQMSKSDLEDRIASMEEEIKILKELKEERGL